MMLKYLVAVLAAACLLLTVTSATAGGVEWMQGDLSAALTKAKPGKIVVVDVFAEWCGPCHKYDKEVFSRADVAEVLRDTVTLRVDGEKEPGKSIVKQYHVVGYPTILFLDAKGTEIDRITGYLEPDAFKAKTSGYLRGDGILAQLQAKLKKTPGDQALRFDVGKRLVMRGELKRALATFQPLIKKGSTFDRQAEVHVTIGKYGHLRGAKDYDAAIDVFERVIKTYPKSKAAEGAFYPLARAHHGKGDTRKALATFDRWIKKKPKAVGRYNSVAWFCFKNDVALDKGVRYARRGLKIDPKAAYLWDTLAEIHFKKGEKKQALKAIKAAVAAAPDDPYYVKQLNRFSKK